VDAGRPFYATGPAGMTERSLSKNCLQPRHSVHRAPSGPNSWSGSGGLAVAASCSVHYRQGRQGHCRLSPQTYIPGLKRRLHFSRNRGSHLTQCFEKLNHV